MNKINYALVMIFFTLYTSVMAQNKGLAIAKKAALADTGFKNSSVDILMTLTNKNRQKSTRKLKNKIFEQTTDGDKSLIIFLSPKDVKGTATLTFTHKHKADDQWLYLPAIKRIKRISSSNKSGPFMGSEFAYEDLSSQEVEKYTYKFIEEKNGFIVVEQYPKDVKSGYTKKKVTYNKNKGYRIEKIEFFDRKGALLKTLSYKNYKQYLHKYWRASDLEMVNHQNDKKTILHFSNYTFQSNLTDADFSQNALKRAGQ